jgi:hypothetical protein
MYAIQLIWLGIMIKSALGGGATKVVLKEDERDKNKKKQ